jgi:hypothetical protein
MIPGAVREVRTLAGTRIGALSLVLGGLLATGCASTPQSTVRSSGTTTVFESPTGRGAQVSGEDAATTARIHAAPIEQVWAATLQALPAVGVPVETMNHTAWTVGTRATRAKGRFAGERISKFLRCGGTAGVIEVADEHLVTLGVLATLQPVETGTAIRFQVAGSAKDPFTSVPARQCASTGALEARVDSTIRAMLQPRQPLGSATLPPR